MRRDRRDYLEANSKPSIDIKNCMIILLRVPTIREKLVHRMNCRVKRTTSAEDDVAVNCCLLLISE